MKKLLVLMLVLGMASLANAILIGTVDWTIDGTDLVGTGKTLGTYDVIITYQDGVNAFGLASDVLTPDAGADDGFGTSDEAGAAGLIQDFGGSFNAYSADGAVAASQINDSEWFRFNITAASEQTVNIWTNGEYGSTLGTINVPEPMTMVLLGLGGLFLRRRK